jgi:hypothetical protein
LKISVFFKESNAFATVQNQSQFVDAQQQQPSGQLPRGAVSRVEGPLFVSKQKTLLTM